MTDQTPATEAGRLDGVEQYLANRLDLEPSRTSILYLHRQDVAEARASPSGLGHLVQRTEHGIMTRFDVYRLRIKARLQTRLVMRRYRVWTLDHVA